MKINEGFRQFVVAAAFTAVFVVIVPAFLHAECIDMPLPRELTANNFYTDKNNSVVDPNRLAATQEKLKPLRDARDYIGKLVDESLRDHDLAKLDCALNNLHRWADSAALTAPLANLEALYNRPLFVLALSLSIIKAGKTSAPETERARQWLVDLAHEDISAYRGNEGIRNNIFYWAGAMAAAVAFFDKTPKAAGFSAFVLERALKEADTDGAFPQEMARGQRALTYQTYATDALIILTQLRQTLGFGLTEDQRALWARIVAFTERSLCEPTSVRVRVHTQQEDVEKRALIPLTTFRPDGYMAQCLMRPNPPLDYQLGGNVEVLRERLNGIRAGR